MSRRIRSAFCARLVLFLVFVCILNVRAHGQAFTFSTIDYPGALWTGANGINTSGQIVGDYGYTNSGSPSYGFLYSGGQFTQINFPGSAGYTWPNGINARGDIVGYYENDFPGPHGFLDRGGAYAAINVPGASYTYALGINDSGQIAGFYYASNHVHGFLYSGGTFTTIDCPGASDTSLWGINDSGQIVGTCDGRVFLYSGGQFTIINFPAQPYGINGSAQIVGYNFGGPGTNGVLDTDGQITTIDVPGARTNIAYGINDGEQIVGMFIAGGTAHGFVANPCGTTSHGLPIISGIHPDGTAESPNWSGYVVIGSSFTSAKGSWRVPAVNCRQTPYSQSAFWVGIDGWPSPPNSTVEQTGTDSYCDGTTAKYDAWYEFYPAPSVPLSGVTVHPGDVISASVTYDPNTQKFTTELTDETTGEHGASPATGGHRALRSTAEWIAEAPCFNGALEPLSDFGTAKFGYDNTGVTYTNDATDSSNSGPISAFGDRYKITMKEVENPSVDKAVPSDLSSDGTSFDVVWEREN